MVVRFNKSWRVCVLVSYCLVDDVGLKKFRKSWIGGEIFSDESLDEDELDFAVLVKQQGLTLSLVVFLEDSEEELDFVILILW